MVTFKELGRLGQLGNQMFQIASTIGVAKKNNDIAIFPNWFCHFSNRDMSRYFKNKIPQFLNVSNVKFHYNEPHFHFKDIPYKRDMSLYGYFQSEKYFSHCKEDIIHYFTPESFITNKLRNKYPFVSEYCSVHVRRGDYLTLWYIHDVCNLDYYLRAMKYVDADKFLVFSDDIPWCKENMPKNCEFAEGNDNVEDLFLMSMCSNNIICNSSFSWWASWLNKNPNKMIVAPNKWFNDDKNYKDIYTENMTRI